MNAQLMTLLQQNRMPEAKALCAKLCQTNPGNAQIHFLMSAICGQLGELQTSEKHCRRSIELSPNVPETWYNLAIIQLRLDKHADAIASLNNALRLKPNFPEALTELGNAHQYLGQYQAAIEHYQAGVRLQPNNARIHCNLGVAQMKLKHVDSAFQSLKTALSLNPNLAEAHQYLGLLLTESENTTDAVRELQQAIELNAGLHEARFALGRLLAGHGKADLAMQHFTAAVAARPDNPEYLNALATALKDRGRHAEAESHFRRATDLAPDNAKLLSNYGLTLIALGKLEEAVATLTRATALDPSLAEAHYNLGTALGNINRQTDAETAYRKATSLREAFPEAWMNLGTLQLLQGRIDEAIASFERAIALRPDYAEANSNLLMALNYTDAVTHEEIFRRHREWGRGLVAPTCGQATPTIRPNEPQRRLRIGFVSADFRTHSVAYFFESLIDPPRPDVEILCYSNTTRIDDVTHRIRNRVALWRDITTLSDTQAAEAIRADAPDVLIDLAGHTSGNRLGIFALRPCPIQITYLGYPNTTGLPTVDYRITDAVADPENNGAFHTETLLRLEDCFLCYTPPSPSPDPIVADVDEPGSIVFGSFNNLAKITPELIAAWAQILRRTPGSRLLIKNRPLADTQIANRLAEAFQAHGIDRDRLQLVGWSPNTEHHLEIYNQIDIALDTYPYNGTTTTCESLWMGRPVVTWRGSRHASRVGASLLNTLGITDLVASSLEDYIDIATGLANDPQKLARTSANLRRRMLGSILCDREAFQARFFDALHGIVSAAQPSNHILR